MRSFSENHAFFTIYINHKNRLTTVNFKVIGKLPVNLYWPSTKMLLLRYEIPHLMVINLHVSGSE